MDVGGCMKAWMLFAGLGLIIAVLFISAESVNAEPPHYETPCATAYGNITHEGDELNRPYFTGTNATIAADRITPIGIDDFSMAELSNQWTYHVWSGQVDIPASMGIVNDKLYMISSNNVDPTGAVAYIYQDARWPNNHTIETWSDGSSENWGAISTLSGVQATQHETPYTCGFYVYTTGTTARIGYQNLANTLTSLGTLSATYNWTLSIENDGINYIGTAVNIDTGVKLTKSVAIASVWNNTNQTLIGIGDFTPPIGGNYWYDCYFDNYSCTNRPSTSIAEFYQYLPHGGNLTHIIFEGNLTKTYIYARSADNYSALMASAWTNITGALSPITNATLNCTLATNMTGSTIAFRAYFNYSNAYIDRITFTGNHRTGNKNMSVSATGDYEGLFDAINGTVDGDTVWLTIGNWVVPTIYSYKNVTLIGEDKEGSLILHETPLSIAWRIENRHYDIEFRNTNLSSPNVGIYRAFQSVYDNSHITLTNARFWGCYYPIYVTYSNLTAAGCYFDYNSSTTTAVSRKAIRVENGNATVENCEFQNYFHGVYIQQGNGIVENNTIYCISTETNPSGYDDAGGIVIYPWTQNGTTIIRNNYIYDASWGISIEEPDHIWIENNYIHESDIAISTVQRAANFMWRHQWRGFGGYNWINNNTLIGDMTSYGIQIYGHQRTWMDGNHILYGNGTSYLYPSIYIYNTLPNEGGGYYGITWINNTLIEYTYVAFSQRSYTSAVGTQEVHINNLTAHDITTGMILLQANRTSTYENITLIGDGTSIGITEQNCYNGTLNNVMIYNFKYGLEIQNTLMLNHLNTTFQNCDLGIYNRPNLFSAPTGWFLDETQSQKNNKTFYNIATPGTTIAVMSNTADVVGDWRNFSNLTFYASPNLGDSLFTAGSKSIRVYGARSTFLTPHGGTISITAQGANITYDYPTTASQSYWLLTDYSYNNVTDNNVDSLVTFELNNLPLIDMMRVFKNDNEITIFKNDTNVSFYATGGYTYELRTTTEIDDLFAGLRHMTNIGLDFMMILAMAAAAIVATILIATITLPILGIFISSMGKTMGRRRR